MEKKYTKEQYEAIDSLRVMIDELNNKPRRLFNSLREFAIAFLEKKGNNISEHLRNVLNSIELWEDRYYDSMGHRRGDELPHILGKLDNEAQDLKHKKHYHRDGESDEVKKGIEYMYNCGVDDTMKRVRLIIATHMLCNEFDFQGYVSDEVNKGIESQLASGNYREVEKKK